MSRASAKPARRFGGGGAGGVSVTGTGGLRGPWVFGDELAQARRATAHAELAAAFLAVAERVFIFVALDVHRFAAVRAWNRADGRLLFAWHGVFLSQD